MRLAWLQLLIATLCNIGVELPRASQPSPVTTRLTPTRSQNRAWSSYIEAGRSSAAGSTAELHGWRDATVEWTGTVNHVHHGVRGHTFVTVVANPSLAEDSQADGGHVEHDVEAAAAGHPAIAAYFEHVRAMGRAPAPRGFDVLVRIEHGSDSSWHNVSDIDVGQQLYFAGTVAVGGRWFWPAVVDAHHFSATYEGVRRRMIFRTRNIIVDRERQHGRDQAVLREAELVEWGGSRWWGKHHSLRSWLEGVLWPAAGSCRGSCEDGRGQRVMPDGEVYHGDWRYGERHGRGVRRWPDGTTYDGQYVHGARSGETPQ